MGEFGIEDRFQRIEDIAIETGKLLLRLVVSPAPIVPRANPRVVQGLGEEPDSCSVWDGRLRCLTEIDASCSAMIWVGWSCRISADATHNLHSESFRSQYPRIG